MDDIEQSKDLLTLTTEIVAAHVSNNTVALGDLPQLINQIYNSLANIGTVPAYTQVNAGVSHEFVGYTKMPFTLRFDVVNVFDTVYEIRDGSGLGVFAPQFGPRRGFFAGWSQKL